MEQREVCGHKFMHWLNARKLTPEHLAKKTGLPIELILSMKNHSSVVVKDFQLKKISEGLDIKDEALVRNVTDVPEFIHWTKSQVENTKRAIRRDGIHFYNYYTLPSPKDLMAPVILDILCPKDRLPALNYGHLEPAITINLGPGDIHGRWNEDLNPTSWQILSGHQNQDHSWILGDSYVEPSYCPHTYSLATDSPARILSYTVKTQLERIINHLNTWSDERFEEFSRPIKQKGPRVSLLFQQMERKGYSLDQLVKVTGISREKVENGDLSLNDLNSLCLVLGLDQRLLLPPLRLEDELGKTHMSRMGSYQSIRPFQSYTVASMAGSPEFPDLTGLFIKVDRVGQVHLDLLEGFCTHYLVTSGELILNMANQKQLTLKEGDALWMAPYVRHGFRGVGSLIKMTNGETLGAGDWYELTKTYNLEAVLKRGRKDQASWGYDN